jgi:hypothetical protein
MIIRHYLSEVLSPSIQSLCRTGSPDLFAHVMVRPGNSTGSH